MKKKVFFGLTLLALVLCVVCCRFTLPQSVSVKTNAKYEFAIANKHFPLGDLFSIEKLRSAFSNEAEGTGNSGDPAESSVDTNVQIYDYNPGGNSDVQQFLITMALQEIPLDFGTYLEKMDFNASIEQMGFSKEFKVPTINVSETKVIETVIDEQINSLVTFSGVTSPRSDLRIAFENDENGFDSISYASGYMSISAPTNEFLTQHGIDISSISVPLSTTKLSGSVQLIYDGNVISEATFNEDGIAKLPLNNTTIYVHDMSFVFNTDPGVYFCGVVEHDSVVKEASNITLKNPVTAPSLNTSFAVGDNSSLKNCVIDEGSLSVELNMPAEWTGITCDYTITLSGGLKNSDGSNIVLESTESTTENLHGKIFTNETIAASADITIKFTNADLQFVKPNPEKPGELININPEVAIGTTITKVASATIALDENYQANVPENIVLGNEVLEMVNRIKWNESGLSVKYTNTLPEGNDFKLRFTSDFFDINEEKLFVHTETEESFDILCEEGHVTEIGIRDNAHPNVFDKVDINAEVILPGYDADNKTITVVGVVPGDTYSINLVITPQINCDLIAINSSLTEQSGNISTGINLGSILKEFEQQLGGNEGEESLASKIKLKALPLYLLCDIPQLKDEHGAPIFQNPAFKGIIKAYVGDAENPSNTVYILSDQDDNGEIIDGILTSASMPAFVFGDENNQVVISDVISADLNGRPYADLKNLISATTDGALSVDYKVSFSTNSTNPGENAVSEIEIPINSIRNLPSSSIKLNALLFVSLDFDVTSPINMDILKLVKNSEESENQDLLGRTEPTSTENFKKFLDAVENVSIVYSPSILPFIFTNDTNDGIAIKIDLDGKDNPGYSAKTISLNGGTFTENPNNLLSIYPLTPSLDFVIPTGNLKMRRNMEFGAQINLVISTNGTISIWDSNASKGGEQ